MWGFLAKTGGFFYQLPGRLYADVPQFFHDNVIGLWLNAIILIILFAIIFGANQGLRVRHLSEFSAVKKLDFLVWSAMPVVFVSAIIISVAENKIESHQQVPSYLSYGAWNLVFIASLIVVATAAVAAQVLTDRELKRTASEDPSPMEPA